MRLDFFLASLMLDHQRLRERLKQAAISTQDLKNAREEARRAGMMRGKRVSCRELISAFGEPEEASEDVLRYSLGIWPDHKYEFGVDELGNTFHIGFVLRDFVNGIDALPLSADAASKLEVGHHTQLEVTRAFGTPSRTLAWNPREEWYYGPLSDNSLLFAEFDFGLLTGLQQQPHSSF